MASNCAPTSEEGTVAPPHTPPRTHSPVHAAARAESIEDVPREELEEADAAAATADTPPPAPPQPEQQAHSDAVADANVDSSPSSPTPTPHVVQEDTIAIAGQLRIFSDHFSGQDVNSRSPKDLPEWIQEARDDIASLERQQALDELSPGGDGESADTVGERWFSHQQRALLLSHAQGVDDLGRSQRRLDDLGYDTESDASSFVSSMTSSHSRANSFDSSATSTTAASFRTAASDVVMNHSLHSYPHPHSLYSHSRSHPNSLRSHSHVYSHHSHSHSHSHILVSPHAPTHAHNHGTPHSPGLLVDTLGASPMSYGAHKLKSKSQHDFDRRMTAHMRKSAHMQRTLSHRELIPARSIGGGDEQPSTASTSPSMSQDGGASPAQDGGGDSSANDGDSSAQSRSMSPLALSSLKTLSEEAPADADGEDGGGSPSDVLSPLMASSSTSPPSDLDEKSLLDSSPDERRQRAQSASSKQATTSTTSSSTSTSSSSTSTSSSSTSSSSSSSTSSSPPPAAASKKLRLSSSAGSVLSSSSSSSSKKYHTISHAQARKERHTRTRTHTHITSPKRAHSATKHQRHQRSRSSYHTLPRGYRTRISQPPPPSYPHPAYTAYTEIYADTILGTAVGSISSPEVNVMIEAHSTRDRSYAAASPRPRDRSMGMSRCPPGGDDTKHRVSNTSNARYKQRTSKESESPARTPNSFHPATVNVTPVPELGNYYPPVARTSRTSGSGSGTPERQRGTHGHVLRAAQLASSSSGGGGGGVAGSPLKVAPRSSPGAEQRGPFAANRNAAAAAGDKSAPLLPELAAPTPKPKPKAHVCFPPGSPSSGGASTRERRGSLRRWVNGLFSKRDRSREDLEDYQRTLKALLATHEKALAKIALERKKLVKTMREELRKCERWGLVKLESAAKTLHETSSLELSTKRDVESKYCEVISTQLHGVQLVLDGKPANRVPQLQWTDDGHLLAAEDIQLPENFCALERSLHSIHEVIKTLSADYAKLQKTEYKSLSTDERGRRLKSILTTFYDQRDLTFQASSGRRRFYYHKTDESGRQVEFNGLMIDDRHTEGKLLKKWRRLIQSSETTIPATSVCTFVTYMVHTITQKYSFDTILRQTLQLSLNRLIFPRINPVWLALRTPAEMAKDAEFRERLKWMKHLSQSQFGIEERFQRDVSILKSIRRNETTDTTATVHVVWPGFPFYDSIVALSEMRQHCVPEDMLHCMLCAIRSVYLEAKAHAADDDVLLSADSLFPIIVWITVHAHLRDINMSIGHLERFLAKEVKFFGEVGYILSLIEAAVVYINKHPPSHFDLPDSVQDDPSMLLADSLYTLPERLELRKQTDADVRTDADAAGTDEVARKSLDAAPASDADTVSTPTPQGDAQQKETTPPISPLVTPTPTRAPSFEGEVSTPTPSSEPTPIEVPKIAVESAPASPVTMPAAVTTPPRPRPAAASSFDATAPFESIFPMQHQRRSSITWSASRVPVPQHTVLLSCAICAEGKHTPTSSSSSAASSPVSSSSRLLRARNSYSPGTVSPTSARRGKPVRSPSVAVLTSSSRRRGAPSSPPTSPSPLNAPGRHPFIRSQKSVADLVDKFDRAIELHRERRVHLETQSLEPGRDARSQSATLADTENTRKPAPKKLVASVGAIKHNSVLYASNSSNVLLSPNKGVLDHNVYRDMPLSPRLSNPLQPQPNSESQVSKLTHSNFSNSVASHTQALITSRSSSLNSATESARSLAMSDNLIPVAESESKRNAVSSDAAAADEGESKQQPPTPQQPPTSAQPAVSPSDPMSLRDFLMLEIRSRRGSASVAASVSSSPHSHAHADGALSPPVSPRAYLASLPSVLAALDTTPPSRHREPSPPESPETREEKKSPVPESISTKGSVQASSESPLHKPPRIKVPTRRSKSSRSSPRKNASQSVNNRPIESAAKAPSSTRRTKSNILSKASKGVARSSDRRLLSRRLTSRRRARGRLLCEIGDTFVKEVVKSFGEVAEVKIRSGLEGPATYALVTFMHAADAARCVLELNRCAPPEDTVRRLLTSHLLDQLEMRVSFSSVAHDPETLHKESNVRLAPKLPSDSGASTSSLAASSPSTPVAAWRPASRTNAAALAPPSRTSRRSFPTRSHTTGGVLPRPLRPPPSSGAAPVPTFSKGAAFDTLSRRKGFAGGAVTRANSVNLPSSTRQRGRSCSM